MGFNSETYKKVLDRMEQQRDAEEARAYAEAEALHIKIPELAEIDRELSSTAAAVAESVFSGVDVEKRLKEIEARNLELQNLRRKLLAVSGLPEDAGRPRYSCAVCSDTGFVNGEMCDCLRRALINETFMTSGIGSLAKTQSFETFSTKYYENDPKALEGINIILLLCRDFAENFTPGNGRNLLFTGNTGLGKTHLSTAIAKVVIEKGNDVVYDTAQNIFSDFEKRQFRTGRDDLSPDPTEKYFDCDLLIIDDLGTELTNSFTVSCLYNIINTRINHRASMIINTNLTQQELRSRYADRITSRLFGEFSPLHFTGTDVRRSKLFAE